ncbi:fumarylacetoacetate hydrolase family protein [Pseudomonas sp. St316]|uniref:fumarylacetoacetate hydrolase family protein n=1 Tax=Pseudomonas sp. St316 TaxID=2678257 RepID=UPI001BB4015E|nr:fumarylacetoacetate hydrolase family protein [Pseudomonas sp. St316]BBP59494.1 2-hydroxyhepta-2,4-diene-1,7-dioate isomerase [Pseudomonas sp. St316]
MRLVRFGLPGQEQPGVLDSQGVVRDLSGIVDDIDASALSPTVLEKLRAVDVEKLPVVTPGTRLGPCVGSVPNLICIGLNYSDHAAETNTPIPSQPVVFNKHTASISGPNDPVILPTGAQKLDWEVELAIVIGTPAWQIDESQALNHIAGYCLANDVSERAYQLEYEGQWTKGKSGFSFAPLGPWLVTRDEISDPQALDLWLDVNGKRLQTGNTRTMIFSVAHIVAYLSRFMPLMPGDVIITGTPPGVGLGQKPPVFLKAGDTMRVGGQGLGEQFQTVVPYVAQMGAAWGAGRHPNID